MESILDPILIVDDEKDNLQALQRLLRGFYDVTAVTSPFEGLRLLQAKTYHVIISDQRMPEMTGVELLEKAQKLQPASTRILLTGYTDIESVIEAINRGHIYRYVAKPWDPEDLKLTLKQANEAYLLRKEVEEKNKDLEKALAELTILDQAKSRFLSLVSHELNTPLTVIQSFVGLLTSEENKLSPEIKKSVSNISSASGRLAKIIGEILSYVRLESSQSALQKSKASLKTLIDQAVTATKAQAQNKKIAVKVSGKTSDKEWDLVQLPLAFEKIFHDLISRTPAQSELQCDVSEEGPGTKVVWSWQGEPLPDVAFEPLETASSQMHHHQNLGLALAIAKRVFDKYGAKIQSASPKKGWASLTLTLA